MHDRNSKTGGAALTALRLLIALGIGLLPTLSLADDSTPMPDHAYIDFGDRWKYERGYKRIKMQCQVVQVPEHAFLATWGNGWECERGYRRSGGHCVSE